MSTSGREIGMSRTTVRSSKDGRRSVMTSSARSTTEIGERRTRGLLLGYGHVEQIAHESGEAVGLHVDEPNNS